MSTSEPKATDQPGLLAQAGRFVLVGGANTLVTAIAFYVLSLWVDPVAAYTIVYLAGLTFVTLATPRLVFGTSAGVRRKLLLAVWYFFVYLCGVGLVRLLSHELDASHAVVVIGTLAITAPLNFVGAHWLVARRKPG